MSLRRHTLRFLALATAVAMVFGAFAGAASAKKLSKKQKAAISKRLMKQVKKNPRIVKKRSFLKQAALVNFKLPITIRLRDSSKSTNPNNATIDLGPSLGQRDIRLGGSLAGEIVFNDSYDGGALGNVGLKLLPSSTKGLQTTSVPLLWNSKVTQAGTSYDFNSVVGAAELQDPSYGATYSAIVAGNNTFSPNGSGCGNWNVSSVGTSPYAAIGGLAFGRTLTPPSYADMPGYPYYGALSEAAASPSNFLAITPGVDGTEKVAASKIPGDVNNIGSSPNPFPAGSAPGGFTPTAGDTVLRTNALNLAIASSGTAVNQSSGSGPIGSQDITVGSSGGQANLFGNIPGKSVGIDITASFSTKIWSLFRITDQDSFGSPLVTGNRWPAGIFNCRNVWSGSVQNYIPGVRLTGSLRIAPAITSDGKLRIAKASVSTGSNDATRVALAACLVPWGGYAAPAGTGAGSDTDAQAIPATASGTIIAAGPTYANLASDVTRLPAAVTVRRQPGDASNGGPALTAATCNSTPSKLVADSALAPNSVSSLTAAQVGNGYTTTASGDRASVAGDLTVNDVQVDVLIGDV